VHPSPICCHFACRLAYAARAPSARKHAQIRTHNNTDTSDKRQASVRTRTHARVRVRTLAKKKREKIKTRAHTHGTSLTHYIHTRVTRGPKSGPGKAQVYKLSTHHPFCQSAHRPLLPLHLVSVCTYIITRTTTCLYKDSDGSFLCSCTLLRVLLSACLNPKP